jgi:hypothetical protein
MLMGAIAGALVFGALMTTANANAVPLSTAAAQADTLSITPKTGTDLTPMTVTSSGPCTAGTNLIVRVFGYGFPSTGKNVVGNTEITTYVETASGGRVVPLADVMRDFAASQPTPFLLTGKYTFALSCIQPLAWNTPLTQFTGAINFTSHGVYTVLASSAAVVPTGANKPAGTTAVTPNASSSTPAKSPTPAATPTKSTTPLASGAPTSASSAGAVTAPSSGAHAAAALPASSTSLSGGSSMAWVLLLALVAIAAIAGGVFWYFRREPVPATPSAHRSRK